MLNIRFSPASPRTLLNSVYFTTIYAVNVFKRDIKKSLGNNEVVTLFGCRSKGDGQAAGFGWAAVFTAAIFCTGTKDVLKQS